MRILNDEEIQEAHDKYAPVWEIDGRQLSKVEILQRQHARLRAPAEAQYQADIKGFIEWVGEHTVLMIDHCGVRTCTFHCTSEEWKSLEQLVEVEDATE